MIALKSVKNVIKRMDIISLTQNAINHVHLDILVIFQIQPLANNVTKNARFALHQAVFAVIATKDIFTNLKIVLNALKIALIAQV